MDWLHKIVAAVLRARTNAGLVGLAFVCLVILFYLSLRLVPGNLGVVLAGLIAAGFLWFAFRRTSRPPPFSLPANYAELLLQQGYFYGNSDTFQKLGDRRQIIEAPSRQQDLAQLPRPTDNATDAAELPL